MAPNCRRYQVGSHSSNPQATDEDKQRATQALEIYQGLSDPIERTEFLREFDNQGGNKGDLAWTATFQKTFTGDKNWKTGVNEDWLTRTAISQMAPIKEMASYSGDGYY